ncbi:MAG: TIGR01777 family protein [Planctomycetes bacterium]|nr:TIGR01777 family protein [Planctomycetota bacterium]
MTMDGGGKLVLMTGGSGLIGTALSMDLLADGHRVLKLRRDGIAPCWDLAAGTIDIGEPQSPQIVVHLAGENIGKGRWSERRKQQFLQSRVRGTTLLCEWIARQEPLPEVLICASAVGYYGDRGDKILDDESSAGCGFVPDLCSQWEAAAEPARAAGVRVVHLRIGVVLTPEDGALKKMLLPFRLGLGGRVGNGQQYMSWISLADAIAGFRIAMRHSDLTGGVNLVSPQPVSNREFTRILAQTLRRPAFCHIPAPVARLLLGEMADALLLASARAHPNALLAAGMDFADPELAKFLQSALHP